MCFMSSSEFSVISLRLFFQKIRDEVQDLEEAREPVSRGGGKYVPP